MATILVRALDQNGDPMRGGGLNNFLTDLDVVAQIVETRLKLLQGEWFLNTADGTPLFQSLLGHATTIQAVATILRSRILGTPYVTGIAGFAFSYATDGRALNFSAQVNSIFGQFQVSNS